MGPPFKDFITIGPRTSLHTPSNPAPGQLIIICTWLGAAPKHISKYTTLYQTIAPRARILLIESNVPVLISSYAHQRTAIAPAVSAVVDVLAHSDPQSFGQEDVVATDGHQPNGGSNLSSSSTGNTIPKILLHTFSNGGTNTATQLLINLHIRLRQPLPLIGLLCDSCPAKGTYWKSYDAMLLSLPKDMASRILGALACHCILILLYSWIAYGNENPASLNRRIMLDSEIVRPELGGAGGRGKGNWAGRVCYLYSKEDRMCQWHDVRDHAEDARKKGWKVDEVVFEGSGHCAHYSKFEDRYAHAVKSVWDGEDGEQDVKVLGPKL